jgi:transketolase
VSTQADLDWTSTDERAVNLIRVLAMDSVRKAGSGHPGTAMSLAPAAYLLCQRLSVEAGITAPWRLFTGEDGASIGVDHFGASADYTTIYREFGITAERVTAAARDSLTRA